MLDYSKFIDDLINEKLFSKHLTKYLPYIKLKDVIITSTELKDNKLYINFQLIGYIGNSSYSYDYTYKSNKLVYELSPNGKFVLDGNECNFDRRFLEDILHNCPDGSIAEQPWPSDYDSDEEYDVAYKEYKESVKNYYDEDGLNHLLSCLPNEADFISDKLTFLIQINHKLSSLLNIEFDKSYIILRNDYFYTKFIVITEIDGFNELNIRITIHNDYDNYYFGYNRNVIPTIDSFKNLIKDIIEKINTENTNYKDSREYNLCLQILERL